MYVHNILGFACWPTKPKLSNAWPFRRKFADTWYRRQRTQLKVLSLQSRESECQIVDKTDWHAWEPRAMWVEASDSCLVLGFLPHLEGVSGCG